jgi:cytidylate kinase
LGCEWVSTGSFYRGLAYVAIQLKADLDNEKELAKLAVDPVWSVEMGSEKTHVIFRGKDVTEAAHQESVGNVASKISQYPLVRKTLLEPQRRCRNNRGLVAEGRDCGSVVFPDAELKIYLTASSENRALRRSQQSGVSKEDIQKLQKIRDNQDLTRTEAPMKVAPGAHVIDTSEMTLPQVVEQIQSLSQTIG